MQESTAPPPPTETPRRGRPRGTGARTVRVQYRRNRKNPARLYIGRRLWQDLGEPARVSVYRMGTYLVLTETTAGKGYAVCGPNEHNTMPRLTCGMVLFEFLGVEEGYYTARVMRDGTQIWADVAPPTSTRKFRW